MNVEALPFAGVLVLFGLMVFLKRRPIALYQAKKVGDPDNQAEVSRREKVGPVMLVLCSVAAVVLVIVA